MNKHDDKKTMVRDMFDAIAPRYDFLNHFLSLGIDRYWRKKAARTIQKQEGAQILDVATGTADFALIIRKATCAEITGIDISENMLAAGRAKVSRAGLDNHIQLLRADSEQLPFPENHFHTATAAFGVRNFADLRQGLREMQRVLQPGGQIVILEFSSPEGSLFRRLFSFYFRRVLPLLAGVFTADKKAYHYLPETALSFPSGEAFIDILRGCGFLSVTSQPLTFGVATIYSGFKPS